MILRKQTLENTKSCKQQLQNAHFHVKPVFPSPLQFTNQNKGRPTYTKKDKFELFLSLNMKPYAISHSQ